MILLLSQRANVDGSKLFLRRHALRLKKAFDQVAFDRLPMSTMLIVSQTLRITKKRRLEKSIMFATGVGALHEY